MKRIQWETSAATESVISICNALITSNRSLLVCIEQNNFDFTKIALFVFYNFTHRKTHNHIKCVSVYPLITKLSPQLCYEDLAVVRHRGHLSQRYTLTVRVEQVSRKTLFSKSAFYFLRCFITKYKQHKHFKNNFNFMKIIIL